MARGVLTDEVKRVSVEQLDYEISRDELRLMPYVQYCIMNTGTIGRTHINRDENRILNDWERKGFIQLDSDSQGHDVFFTKKFYQAIYEILMVGYCSDYIIEE